MDHSYYLGGTHQGDPDTQAQLITKHCQQIVLVLVGQVVVIVLFLGGSVLVNITAKKSIHVLALANSDVCRMVTLIVQSSLK